MDIDAEVIRTMEATIHDYTQYRGGYERLTPDERAEVMEAAIRAADEKRGLRVERRRKVRLNGRIVESWRFVSDWREN